MDSRLNKVLRDFDDAPTNNRRGKKVVDDEDEDDLCQLMDKYA